MKKNAVLAIETAIGHGSLSLWRGAAEIAGYVFNDEISRSVDLLAAIDQLLRRANVVPAELRKILVSKGTGSLTGLRVGAATALGLKNSLSIDYAANDIFDALEMFYIPKNENGVTALLSGKNKIFWRLSAENVNDSDKRQNDSNDNQEVTSPLQKIQTSENFFDRELIESVFNPAVEQGRRIFVNESLYRKIVDLSASEDFRDENILNVKHFCSVGDNLAFYHGHYLTGINVEMLLNE